MRRIHPFKSGNSFAGDQTGIKYITRFPRLNPAKPQPVIQLLEFSGTMRYIGPSGDKKFTKPYRTWLAIRKRCNSPKNPAYKWYGGRGISVCKEWVTFEPFYKWCQESGCTDGLTIDRVDNDGDYSPENCRWIPQSEQRINQSNVRWIEFDGKRLSVKGWADFLGVSPPCLHYRLKAWGKEKALTKK